MVNNTTHENPYWRSCICNEVEPRSTHVYTFTRVASVFPCFCVHWGIYCIDLNPRQPSLNSKAIIVNNSWESWLAELHLQRDWSTLHARVASVFPCFSQSSVIASSYQQRLSLLDLFFSNQSKHLGWASVASIERTWLYTSWASKWVPWF